LNIIPVFRRELVHAVRREGIHSQRGYFAGFMLLIVMGTFGAWAYAGGWELPNFEMARAAERAFLLVIGLHAMALMGGILVRTTMSIAGEKDRRTLDFLIITRLSAAEIVMEKLAACLVVFATTILAGLPVMLLLHLLGGVDSRLILMTYGGIATTTFFLASLGIWFSVMSPDGRQAVNTSVLTTVAWLMGPLMLPMVLSRFGLRLPEWAAMINAWLIASSPLSLLMKVAMGVGASKGLTYAIAWMSGLQTASGVLLLIGSIARLRSAFRAQASVEIRERERARRLPVWRLRPRPAVGDDPILWREMYTTTANGFMKAIGIIINLGVVGALAYATYYFARPAVVEVWRHGYSLGATRAANPEMNLFVRMFMTGSDVNAPVDLARMEFNVFLRYVTLTITLLLSFIVAGTATEILMLERRKETWGSLLATPLSARDILRSTILALIWRLRGIIVIVVILCTIGLLAGAVHPLGYLFTMLNLAASIWMFAMWGIRASVGAKDMAAATSRSIYLAVLLMVFLVLPFLLPRGFKSVLLAAGSHPSLIWLSLVSYRDVHDALRYGTYPPLEWVGIHTEEGALRVLATYLIGTIGPALMGWRAWRRAVGDFDRLVGRPWRAEPSAPTLSRVKLLPAPEPGSPLAEPGGAV
jgi:ABC-type transport system involved in multi-copper enzyme maturation permease subunit